MRRLVLVALAIVACNDAPAPPNLSSGTQSSSEGGEGVSAAGSSDEAGTADASTGTLPPDTLLDVQLDLEAIEDVRIQIVRVGDEVTAKVELSRGYGVAPAGDVLEGPARIDALPEAGATIYTARLSAPLVADGPCGDAPVSLALALHHDEDDVVVAGGLTAYCGADTWFGVPPIEPLRISGKL